MVQKYFLDCVASDFFCGFLFFLDLPALSQPGPSGNFQPNYSYMTSGALCLGIIIIFSYFLQQLIFMNTHYFRKTAGGGIVVFSMLMGSHMVYSHFTSPQWHDRYVLEKSLKQVLIVNPEIKKIILYPPINPLQKGIGEYAWRNYDAEFYTKLLVRSILNNIGYIAKVSIVMKPNNAKKIPLIQKNLDGLAIIDLRSQ